MSTGLRRAGCTAQHADEGKLDDVLDAKAVEAPVANAAGEQDAQLGPIGGAPAVASALLASKCAVRRHALLSPPVTALIQI